MLSQRNWTMQSKVVGQIWVAQVGQSGVSKASKRQNPRGHWWRFHHSRLLPCAAARSSLPAQTPIHPAAFVPCMAKRWRSGQEQDQTFDSIWRPSQWSIHRRRIRSTRFAICSRCPLIPPSWKPMILLRRDKSFLEASVVWHSRSRWGGQSCSVSFWRPWGKTKGGNLCKTTGRGMWSCFPSANGCHQNRRRPRILNRKLGKRFDPSQGMRDRRGLMKQRYYREDGLGCCRRQHTHRPNTSPITQEQGITRVLSSDLWRWTAVRLPSSWQETCSNEKPSETQAHTRLHPSRRRHVAKPWTEEPDAGNPHVRIFGSLGGAIPWGDPTARVGVPRLFLGEKRCDQPVFSDDFREPWHIR